MTSNELFIGGPVNGKWMPVREGQGHVVCESKLVDAFGRPRQWTYYLKYLKLKPAKRRDGRKVLRRLRVFALAGTKLELQAENIRRMMLCTVPGERTYEIHNRGA